MSLNLLSFLGIGTHQGQEKIGLSYSAQRALELIPQEWPIKASQVLVHHAERKAIIVTMILMNLILNAIILLLFIISLSVLLEPID